MSQTVLRDAQPDDIPAITSIYAHAVVHGTATFELEPPDATEMARRYRALVDASFPYLVAEIDGRVVGYAYAGQYRPRIGYRWTVEDSIYIASDLHRRGVGRALLTRLIGEAETRGFRQMIAVIGDATQTASIALHEALGFRHIGMLHAVAFKHEGWRDSILMQRALGAGATTTP
jgi:phosphinothricin acetyltransferase